MFHHWVMAMQSTLFFIICLIFAIGGAVLFFYGLKELVDYINSRRHRVRLEARIVDENSYIDDEGSELYAPVFEYDFGDQQYRNTSELFTLTRPTLNESVVIMADPDSPGESEIDTWKITALQIIPAAGGLLLCALGSVMAWMNYKGEFF